MNVEPGTLMRLGDSGQMLTDPGQDIRGRKVVDRDGSDMGEVSDLLIDPASRKVRLLLVEHGGLLGVGVTSSFIPVEIVERVTDGEVGVDSTRAQVAAAPVYDPQLVDRDDQMAVLYRRFRSAP